MTADRQRRSSQRKMVCATSRSAHIPNDRRTPPLVGEGSPPMSWRPGELWLDTDLLWFRESPAVAGFAPAPIPSFGPPPGLLASRLRRAAWERRRHSRRARATALALSPAAVFALAAFRSGGGQGSSVAVEDPPTLT